MMKLATVAALILLLLPAAAGAQADRRAVEAFDHYEAIRVSLARDGLADVAKNAAALAPLAGAIAGKEAEAAANRLRTAKTLNQARDEFGSLSLVLVPKFLDAKVPGVSGFMCAMKPNAMWAQRGDTMENPYFGKVMLNCGARIQR